MLNLSQKVLRELYGRIKPNSFEIANSEEAICLCVFEKETKTQIEKVR